MSRSMGQKAKIMVLLELLWQRTDEEHRLSVPQMIEHLRNQGITAERKSVYSDIEALQAAGFEIQCQRGPGGGYYMVHRPFELAELKLLVDAVQGSRFITTRKSESLIRKLESLTSDFQARQMQRQVMVTGRVKNMNESILYSVDGLHQAISEDHQVSFLYSDWNLNRERVPRKEGQRYLVSPWALVWNNDNYYLVAYLDQPEGGEIRHYRVDKMSRIRVEEKRPRQGKKEFEQLDLAAYTRSLFGMFGGETKTVRLRCANKLVDAMLDRFGRDVTLLEYRKDTFDLYTEVTLSQQFAGWVCGFGGDVQVLEPAEARQMMRQLANTLCGQYAADPV